MGTSPKWGMLGYMGFVIRMGQVCVGCEAKSHQHIIIWALEGLFFLVGS